MIESELFFVLFLVLKQCSFPIGINKVHQFNSIQFYPILFYKFGSQLHYDETNCWSWDTSWELLDEIIPKLLWDFRTFETHLNESCCYLFLTLAVVGTLIGLEDARLPVVLGHLYQAHRRLHRGVAGVDKHHHLRHTQVRRDDVDTAKREQQKGVSTSATHFKQSKGGNFYCKLSLLNKDKHLCNSFFFFSKLGVILMCAVTQATSMASLPQCNRGKFATLTFVMYQMCCRWTDELFLYARSSLKG